MVQSSHTISVITDEVSPRLEDGIAFALDERLTHIDIRSIGGVNFLSLDHAAQHEAARKIAAAGLTVGCLATPLLKWAVPGAKAGHQGDQFGFDRQGRSIDAIYRDAFDAAALLGTRHLRIFTLRTYEGFALADLRADFEHLLELAESRDAVLHVENEPVCNIMSVADLLGLLETWRHARLRGLLDIGNAWWAGKPPTHADLRALMPYVGQMHIKDYDTQAQRVVPLGEGDILYVDLLRTCLQATPDKPLTLTVETHVPADPIGATRKSLARLRACLAEVARLDGQPAP